MAKKNTFIVVKGKRWVVEGDNYAGFSGYREKVWNFFNVEDYNEFMQVVVHDPEFTKVTSIETFTIKPDKVLDVKLQLQLATENRNRKAKQDEKAELLREKQKLEKRLKELA